MTTITEEKEIKVIKDQITGTEVSIDTSSLDLYLQAKNLPVPEELQEKRKSVLLAKQNSDKIDTIIQKAYEQGVSPEQLAPYLLGFNDDRKEEEKGLIDRLSEDSPNFDPVALRRARNMKVFVDTVNEELNRNYDEASYPGLGLDILDRYVLRSGVELVEAFTGRADREAKEVYDAFSKDPEAFKMWLQKKIEEAGEEGITRGDNYFRLKEMLASGMALGEDSQTDVETALVGVLGLGFGSLALDVLRPTAKLALKAAMKKGGPDALDTADGSLVKPATDAAVVSPSEADNITKAAVTAPEKATADVLDDAESTGVRIAAEDQAVPAKSETIWEVTKNKMFRFISDELNSGKYGAKLLPEEEAKLLADMEGKLLKATNRPFIRGALSKVVKGPDVWKTEAEFGTKSGKAFTGPTAQANANNLLKSLPEGTSAKIVATNDGLVVRVKKNHSLSDYIDAGKDPYEMHHSWLKTFLARWVGSNAQLDSSLGNALALRAEQGLTVLSKVHADHTKLIKKLPHSSLKVLKETVRRLRDDPLHEAMSDGYSMEELVRIFEATKKDLNGGKPISITEAELDALNSTAELEVFDWLMQAERILGELTSRGTKAVVGEVDGKSYRIAGNRVTPKAREKLKPNKTVLTKEGRVLKVSDLSENDVVWELFESVKVGRAKPKYVVNPVVDELSHSDVLARNSGGRRTYDYDWFVGTSKGMGRAFMGAITRKQAEKAVNALKTLQAKFIESGGQLTDDVVAKIAPLWNRQIDTSAKLDEFLGKYDIDLAKAKFDFKASGDVYTTDYDNYVTDFAFKSYKDYHKFTKRRGYDMVTEVGTGDIGRTGEALDSIVSGSASVLQRSSRNAYTLRFAKEWAKRARASGAFNIPKGTSWDNPLSAVSNATLAPGVKRDVQALLDAQDILKRRMGTAGIGVETVEKAWLGFADMVFDSTGKGRSLRNLKGVNRKAMALSFYLKFGFFNVQQLVVQTMHIPVMLFASPVNGIKAFGLHAPIRAILTTTDHELREHLIKNLSKTPGLKEDYIREMVEFIETSGRNKMDSEFLELGGYMSEGLTPSWMMNNAAIRTAGKGYDAIKWAASKGGLMFFKQAELTSRYQSQMMAFIEWKAKNPEAGSSLTEAGRNWITNKDHALSLHMTSASRGRLQDGVPAVATQWLSYARGTLETMFYGKHLTKGQRLRMSAAQLALFGMTGAGVIGPTSQDEVLDYFGVDDHETRMLWKRGLMDELFSEVLGTDTYSSERFSALWGVRQIVRDLIQNNPAEVALGPSGSIIFDVGQSTYRLARAFVDGNPLGITERTVETLRNISAVDTGYKVYSIYKTGTFTSRLGAEAPVEGLSETQAVALLLGIKPEEVHLAEEARVKGYNLDTIVRDMSSYIRNELGKVNQYIREGDDESASTKLAILLEEVNALNLPPKQGDRLRRQLLNGGGSAFKKMFEDLAYRGMTDTQRGILTSRENN